MLARRFHSTGKQSLLSRYSQTLGELTLRRQTETAVLAAAAESDLANKAKSAFLATMSHELRTPLNAIIGFADVIHALKPADGGTAKGADYAQQIARAGRHLLDVVSDILDISKIESGTFQLNLELFSLSEIVRDCVGLVQERLNEKNQKLELRLDPSLPELFVDVRRVRQILINLLSNAGKFTPDGGRILVAARRTKAGGGMIAVVDSGIGMSPEQIKIAMTPFGQVQSTYARTQEGTGLGLPIALGLARQQGADLYLESLLGQGTSAVLTFSADPRMRPSQSAAPPGGGERYAPRRPTLSVGEQPI